MSAVLTLGISTCPNDTFIFHGLIHGLVDLSGLGGVPPRVTLADVEELNRLALGNALHVCKVSAAVWPRLASHYALLSSGAALGRGNGPVLVTRQEEKKDAGFTSIAIPGEHTTAALLLERYGEAQAERLAIRFDRIPQAVLQGQAEAGVLIHEGRFTYAAQNLRLVRDLGQWWEQMFALPLPLGCIVARKDLGEERIGRIDAAVRESLELALQNPDRTMEFVRRHAQELDDHAIRQHIETFVTPHSLNMGQEGRQAMARLTGSE